MGKSSRVFPPDPLRSSISVHFLFYKNCSAIHGFISRQETEECLHKSENGTFLIRFSDTELGGVTVAWITGVYNTYVCSNELVRVTELSPSLSSVNDGTGQRQVAMLQPYSRKDLMIRSLSDRINDYVQMSFLYPNIRKEVAFGKYLSQQHEAMPPRNLRNGYVPHHLVNVIQG